MFTDACKVRGVDIDTIRSIPDPAERVRAANTALVETKTALLALRRAAIQEMRQTMSIAQVASALGVSRTRVTQLEK